MGLFTPFPGAGPIALRSVRYLLQGLDGRVDCSKQGMDIGFNDVIACVGTRMGATFVDTYTPFRRGPKDLISKDGLHPSDDGYAVIAERFERAIADPPAPPARREPRAMSAEQHTRMLIGGDALRGAAAIGVICGHVAAYALYVVDHEAGPSAVGFDDFIAHYGAIGLLLSVLIKSVWVFFVLSGYLIARPTIAAYCAGRPLPNLPRYVRRRVLRIVPAFWVTLAISALVIGTHGAGALDVAAVVLLAQTYAGSAFGASIGQAWTLGAEMTFYLLVPIAGIVAVALTGRRLDIRRRVAAVVLAAGAIFAVSLGAALLLGRDDEHLRYAPAILFAFMPGVVLAALEQVLPQYVRDRRAGRVLALAVLVVSLALFVVAGLPGSPSGSGRLVVVIGSGGILAALLLKQWTDGVVLAAARQQAAALGRGALLQHVPPAPPRDPDLPAPRHRRLGLGGAGAADGGDVRADAARGGAHVPLRRGPVPAAGGEAAAPRRAAPLPVPAASASGA